MEGNKGQAWKDLVIIEHKISNQMNGEFFLS